MPSSLDVRAARHAALGDPIRLAIVERLIASDRSPVELRHLTGTDSNLLAHHLDVLERVGLIRRKRSSGDQRRRYVQLQRQALHELVPDARVRRQPILFVCSQNSARSQLAAALWLELTAQPATSAGTHPAPRVHPGAVRAARRAGLDLSNATPRQLDDLAVGSASRRHRLRPGPRRARSRPVLVALVDRRPRRQPVHGRVRHHGGRAP